MIQLKNFIRKEDQEGKFEEGVLTSEGCMKRHQGTRDKELNIKDPADGVQYGGGAWREEMNVLSAAHSLKSMGFKMRKRGNVSERIESFIRRHDKHLKYYEG